MFQRKPSQHWTILDHPLLRTQVSLFGGPVTNGLWCWIRPPKWIFPGILLVRCKTNPRFLHGPWVRSRPRGSIPPRPHDPATRVAGGLLVAPFVGHVARVADGRLFTKVLDSHLSDGFSL